MRTLNLKRQYIKIKQTHDRLAGVNNKKSYDKQQREKE